MFVFSVNIYLKGQVGHTAYDVTKHLRWMQEISFSSNLAVGDEDQGIEQEDTVGKYRKVDPVDWRCAPVALTVHWN